MTIISDEKRQRIRAVDEIYRLQCKIGGGVENCYVTVENEPANDRIIVKRPAHRSEGLRPRDVIISQAFTSDGELNIYAVKQITKLLQSYRRLVARDF